MREALDILAQSPKTRHFGTSLHQLAGHSEGGVHLSDLQASEHLTSNVTVLLHLGQGLEN